MSPDPLKALVNQRDRASTDARKLDGPLARRSVVREVCLACRAPFDRAAYDLAHQLAVHDARRDGRHDPAYVPVTRCPACGTGELVEVAS